MRDPGLTPDEVSELIKFINQNNGWDKMYETIQSGRKCIKYYNMTVDTRTGTVWRIEFYDVLNAGGNHKDKYVFRTENGYNLKDRIYEWLNEIVKEK